MQFASKMSTLSNLAIISLHFVIASNVNTELHQTPFILRSYRLHSGRFAAQYATTHCLLHSIQHCVIKIISILFAISPVEYFNLLMLELHQK